MKKVKLSGKLSLNKETIERLNDGQMNMLNGGGSSSYTCCSGSWNHSSCSGQQCGGTIASDTCTQTVAQTNCPTSAC